MNAPDPQQPKEKTMTCRFIFAAAMSFAVASGTVHAHAEASAVSAISALPIASVAVGASAGGASVAIPAMLSVSGAVFVVKVVEASARGTVCVLERISDGARVSIEIAGRGLAGASLVTGSAVTASVISAGVVLSVAGQAIAFIPNAIGRALLHNEQLTF